MAKAKEKQMEKPTEQKPIWHSAEKVLLKEVRLVRNPQDSNLLKAVKFITADNREIVYYPQNEEKTTSVVADFTSDLTEKKPYAISEFILSQKMLIVLNKNLKSEYQEVVMTYQESVFRGMTYFKLFRNQYETIYYEKFHGENKENLEKMLTNKAKYEVDIEMPMD